MHAERFPDRVAAGQVLAEALLRRRGWREIASSGGTADGVVVLALPRGGVPVAAPIAATLRAALDVLVVRKLGLPSQPELAMGAIAGVDDDVEVVSNDRVLTAAQVPGEQFDAVLAAETAALRDRERRYRSGPAVAVAGRVVVLVDDGLATGSTMRAAVAALRRRGPAEVVVAVPVGAPATCSALSDEVDQLVCPAQPTGFVAVGQAYDDFSPTSDDEVREILVASRRRRAEQS